MWLLAVKLLGATWKYIAAALLIAALYFAAVHRLHSYADARAKPQIDAITAERDKARADLEADRTAQRDYKARTDAALTKARDLAIAEGLKREQEATKDKNRISALVAQVAAGKLVAVSAATGRVLDAAGAVANGDKAPESGGKDATVAIPDSATTAFYDERELAQYFADGPIAYRDAFNHWASCVAEYEGAEQAQQPKETQ